MTQADNSIRGACRRNLLSISQLTMMSMGGAAPLGFGGKLYHVDANASGSGSGLSWGQAFETMAEAFATVASGDAITFRGKIKEQVVTPAQVFDVTVFGAGNRPRHADSTPDGGQDATNSWTEPDTETAATALVRVQQQGWRFANILFYGGDDNACIELYRDAGADDDERDASHLEVIGCRFASGYNGISDIGGCYGVGIYGNRFGALTNYCMLGVGNIGAGQGNWIVEDNHFYGFTNGVKCAFSQSRIKGNTFTAGGTPNTTVVLNTVNAIQGDNFVVDNYFQTATANFNTPDVEGNATDVWNNTSIDGTTGMIGREVGTPA
jgi:hypothetical protein